MDLLRFTLLTDGRADRKLLPIARWVLRQHTALPLLAAWADLSIASNRPTTLEDRIQAALSYYPADLLLVHRDAEGRPLAERVREVQDAAAGSEVVVVPLVPVRMQEAWLLFDEQAIREAAANPRGRTDLHLPAVARLEAVADPKTQLREVLRLASDKKGRHIRRFDDKQAAYRLADLITDYSPLRQLPAFRQFEASVEGAVRVIEAASVTPSA